MGKTSSKSDVMHNADPQVRIINNQEYHAEMLQQHETLIYLILGIVATQLLLTLYFMLKKRERNRAFKLAKSVNNLVEA